MADTDTSVTTALMDVVRDVLSSGGQVSISGLGTFSIVHEPSQVTSVPGGRVHVSPPRDVISFIPDMQSEA